MGRDTDKLIDVLLEISRNAIDLADDLRDSINITRNLLILLSIEVGVLIMMNRG